MVSSGKLHDTFIWVLVSDREFVNRGTAMLSSYAIQLYRECTELFWENHKECACDDVLLLNI